MRKTAAAIIGPLLGIGLIILVAWVLADKFRDLQWGDVVRYLLSTSPVRIAGAVALTIVYYAAITGYDSIAFRIIGHPLPYRRIAIGSFTAYALSHNIGLSAVTGGSVRYRIYSGFGLTATEVAKVVFFTTLSYWIGLLTVASAVFLLLPISLPPALHLPFQSARPIGFISLALLISYFWISTHTRNGKKIAGLTVPHLHPVIILRQMLIGSVDWLVSALIVFTLLSRTLEVVRFGRFFEIFVLAQFAALSSQLPGGIGVFESVILLLLPPRSNVAAVLGALLLYRIIFYLLPLVVSLVSLVTHEVGHGRRRLLKLRIVNGQHAYPPVASQTPRESTPPVQS